MQEGTDTPADAERDVKQSRVADGQRRSREPRCPWRRMQRGERQRVRR